MDKRRIISRGNRRGVGHAIVAAVLIMAVGALAWAGGDPWKTKPFEQWNENDIRQILHDSPWAKVESIPADWKPSQYGGANPGERQWQSGIHDREVKYHIRWNSSRTVHEALVRDAILSGKIKESDAGKYLSAPINDYEVLVVGSDMTPFRGVSDTEFKSKSYLRGKQSKVQVNPTKVEMMQSSDGSQLMSVVFTFPRKTADGKDIAAPQEKGLEFVCKIKNFDLSTTFDLRKMADSKGPDF